jgi:hypothetical protein
MKTVSTIATAAAAKIRKGVQPRSEAESSRRRARTPEKKEGGTSALAAVRNPVSMAAKSCVSSTKAARQEAQASKCERNFGDSRASTAAASINASR